MKQLELFVQPSARQSLQETPNMWELYVDGAARNNPGPAGAGIYILKNGEPVVREGFYLGSKTNNQAEYLALIIALVIVTDRMEPEDTISIVSDSELLVKQIQGSYKVRQPELQKLHAQALRLLEPLYYHIRHVLRENNPVADELANHGIDKKNPLPAAVAAKVAL